MGRFAIEFASHLVAEEFTDAHEMLSSSLRTSLSPEDLRHEFESMTASGDGWPDSIEAVGGDEDWPDKQPPDLGWVYVSISGDGFNEAVTVTVTVEDSKPVIRDIEWGRP